MKCRWSIFAAVVCLPLVAGACAGGNGESSLNPDPDYQAQAVHSVFDLGSPEGQELLDLQLVRDSNGGLHAFALVAHWADGCMNTGGEYQCVDGGGTFEVHHFASSNSGASWSRSGAPASLAADVCAHMLAAAGRNGETMVGVAYRSVVGMDAMGGLIYGASHVLYVWPSAGAEPVSYVASLDTDGELGAHPHGFDFLVADRFNRYLLGEDRTFLMVDATRSTAGEMLSNCYQEFRGYSENGLGGAEQPSQRAVGTDSEGDFVIANWNSLRPLDMSPADGTCLATNAGLDYHNSYAPDLYLTRQSEGLFGTTTRLTSDFLRDFHLNLQGDPPREGWYRMALLDIAGDSDGTLYLLGAIIRDWVDYSGAPPIPFGVLFKVSGETGPLELLQVLNTNSARFLKTPDGKLAVATAERHLWFLEQGGVDHLAYGPALLASRRSVLLDEGHVGILQQAGFMGAQFAVYPLKDLGAAPVGVATATPGVGPSPLATFASALFTAAGDALTEATWWVDFNQDSSLPKDLSAYPDGVPMPLLAAGLHILGARVAASGKSVPATDQELTPPSLHTGALALVESVEPVGGTWFERFHVQPFHPVSVYGVLMDEKAVYEVEPTTTLHLYGRGENGTLQGSNTYTAGTPPWGPPPAVSSTEFHNIALENNKLIINVWSGGGIGFVVLDVSDGINYVDLGTITAFSPQPNFYPICRDMAVKNGLIACGGDYRIHFADLETMSGMGTHDLSGDSLDIMRLEILDNGYIAALADTRLAIIDPGLGGEGHGQLFGVVAWVNPAPGTTLIGASGNWLAFTTNGDIVWVDCTNPTSPQVEPAIEIPGLAWSGRECHVNDDTLWCANSIGSVPNAISTLDVYDALEGTLLGRYLEYRPSGVGSFGLSKSGEALIPLSQTEARIVRWHR